MSRRRFLFGFVNFFVVLSMLAATTWVVLNRQQVVDWWRLRQYTPTEQVMQLADATTMHGRGRNLFYVSDPQVQDQQSFNVSCQNDTSEKSIVLGCYTFQHIYIYAVNDSRLQGVREVTAAHEMLHAAYERLSAGEQKRINRLLDSQIAANTDPRIAGLIELYNKQEPGQLHNEMHSILGTEVANLSPDLESYYSQYFTDRGRVVVLSQMYEGVLSASKQKIADLETQLSQLKTHIDQQNQLLKQQEAELQAQSVRLRTLRDRGDFTGYNAGVSEYNAKVQAFNSLVNDTRAAITSYNQIVDQHNQEVAAQTGLYQSLDSTYQPVNTN